MVINITEYFDIQLKIYQKINEEFYEIKSFGEVIDSTEILDHWFKIKQEFDIFFKKIEQKLHKKPTTTM